MQFTAVQSFFGRKATAYLSFRTETEISIEKLHLEFFDRILVDNVLLKDEQGDTLIYLGQADLSLRITDLLQGKIGINSVCLTKPTVEVIKLKGEELTNLKTTFDKLFPPDTTSELSFFIALDHLEIIDGQFKFSDNNYRDSLSHFNLKHIRIKKMHLYAHDLEVSEETLDISEFELSFSERDFRMDHLSSSLTLGPDGILLNQLFLDNKETHIHSTLAIETESWKDYEDFENKVSFDINVLPSTLDLRDWSHFLPDLEGIDKIPSFSGRLKGKVSELEGKNLKFALDNDLRATMDVSLRGLPKIKETYFFLSINELISSKRGVESIPLPPFREKKKIILPKNFANVGAFKFNGRLTGFINNMVADGIIISELGTLETDLALSYDGVFHYDGKVKARNFEAGKFLDAEKTLGTVNMSADIKGKGFTKRDVDARLVAKIQSLELNKYEYQNVNVSGDFKKERFTGHFDVQDKNLQLDFDGTINLSDKIKEFEFAANIEHLKLKPLAGLDYIDSLATVSAYLSMDLKATNIDSLVGVLKINELYYTDIADTLEMSNLEFVSQREGKKKDITLESDIFDFYIRGNFDMLDGFKTGRYLAHKYLPNAYREASDIDKSFGFNLQIKDYSLIEKLATPDILVDSGTRVIGSFESSTSNLDINAFILNFTRNNFSIDTTAFHIFSSGDKLLMDGQIKNYSFGEKQQDRVINISSSASENTVITSLNSSGNGPLSTQFNIATQIINPQKIELNFYDSEVSVHDTVWVLDSLNLISIDTSGVDVKNLKMNYLNQEIALEGKWSKSIDDPIFLRLKNFDLSIVNEFGRKDKAQLEGIVDGQASIMRKSGDLLFQSDLEFEKLKFNDYNLGSGIIASNWDNIQKELIVNGNLKYKDVDKFRISGKVKTRDPISPLQLKLALNDLPLMVLNPLTDGILSDFQGSVSGKVNINGKLEKPELTGQLYANNGGLTVDYTNVSYKIYDPVQRNPLRFDLYPDSIRCSSFLAEDEDKNQGLGSVTFIHDGFKYFNVDLRVKAKNLLGINTTIEDNERFYGKAFITGDVNIWAQKGFSRIDIDVTTENKSRLNIPLSDESEITEGGFIVFEQPKNLKQGKKKDSEEQKLINVQLNLSANLTTGTQIRLIFDEATGDVIQTRGTGKMDITYDPENSLGLVGEYEISSGSYNFVLENLVNKKFVMERGSKIRWNGDPYKGEMDIVTVYKLRARLADILPDLYENYNYNRNIPVDLRLNLNQSIESPVIGFDVFLPQSQEEIRNQLRTELSNDGCLNQQVFSLLIIGSFTPCESVEQSGTNTNVGRSTAYEAMANQLGNWLSKISDDVDVGVSYRPEDDNVEETGTELEVALSTQLFNDRLIVDGNLGYGNQRATTQNNRDVVGEFNVEYKIRPDGKLRVKAFNQVNERSYIENDNLYIQGVGLKYSRDYDTLGQLWREMIGRKSQSPKVEDPPPTQE